MTHSFYFVIDGTGTTRIGYLKDTGETQAKALFERAHVRQILLLVSIPKTPEPILFFAFEARHQTMGHIHGTVEGTDWDAALQTLKDHLHMEVVALKEGQTILKEERDAVIHATAERLGNSKPENISTQQPQTKKIEEEQQTGRSTLLIQRFHEVLVGIKNVLSDLKKDHAFHDDIRELETSMDILFEKESFSHRELFDYAGYLLRELSFFEESLDPSMLKDSLKEHVTSIVDLLAGIEEQMKRMAKHDSTKQVGDMPRHQTDKSLLFGDLKESFLKYKEKKDSVTREEVTFSSKRTHSLEAHKEMLSLAGGTIILDEIPHVTGVLTGIYTGGLLFALWTFVYDIHITLFSFPLSESLQYLYRQGTQLKMVIALILIHITALIIKHFRSQRQMSIMSIAVCFLLIVIIFALF